MAPYIVVLAITVVLFSEVSFPLNPANASNWAAGASLFIAMMALLLAARPSRLRDDYEKGRRLYAEFLMRGQLDPRQYGDLYGVLEAWHFTPEEIDTILGDAIPQSDLDGLLLRELKLEAYNEHLKRRSPGFPPEREVDREEDS